MEDTAIEPHGSITKGHHGIWSDDHIAGLSRITSFLRQQGAVPGIQLAHAGRKGSTDLPWDGGGPLSTSQGAWQTIAPSAIPFDTAFPVPKEMTVAEIHAIAPGFAAAADRALRAGFELLEIHAAHGYQFACDGENSFVRRALGLPLEGRADIEDFVNVYFRADLMHLVEDRWFGICFVENPECQGLFLPVDNVCRWLLNVQFKPSVTPPSSFTAERCIEPVRAAVGDPKLPVEILSAMPWKASALVSPRLRQDRIFLVGDSAHIMPPAGAFGLNTAVQEAHNLPWKLAAVLKGNAGDRILDSNERERLPVAVALAQQAERDMQAPNPWEQGSSEANHTDGSNDWSGDHNRGQDGDPNPWDQPLEEQVRTVIGFQYRSRAVAEGETVRGLNLQCQPGTRFPHVWLPDGRSTLDLFGPQFAVVLPEGSECLPSIPAGVSLVTLPGQVWAAVSTTGSDEAILVRPDHIVAARCTAGRIECVLKALTSADGDQPQKHAVDRKRIGRALSLAPLGGIERDSNAVTEPPSDRS